MRKMMLYLLIFKQDLKYVCIDWYIKNFACLVIGFGNENDKLSVYLRSTWIYLF